LYTAFSSQHWKNWRTSVPLTTKLAGDSFIQFFGVVHKPITVEYDENDWSH